MNEDGLTFDQWYTRADREVGRIIGLGLDDLPDGPSHDAWSDGVPPEEYAHDQLAEEGFPF